MRRLQERPVRTDAFASAISSRNISSDNLAWQSVESLCRSGRSLDGLDLGWNDAKVSPHSSVGGNSDLGEPKDRALISMITTICTFDLHGQAILDIFNEAIANSTALYEYQPRTLQGIQAWFEAKAIGKFPVLGVENEAGELMGFASYGSFRAFPGFKYTVEHSVYVSAAFRRGGIGRQLLTQLIATAQTQNYHVMIGGVDADNVGSISLHRSLGFSHCASIKQAGFKFGRWLDLEFYQLLLPTPSQPADG